MIDSEMLSAIGKMLDEKLEQKLEQKLDEKLKPINDRLEILEIKQELTHKKLDDLTLDVKISERAVRRDIHALQDAQETLIAIMEAKGILPKVDNL